MPSLIDVPRREPERPAVSHSDAPAAPKRGSRWHTRILLGSAALGAVMLSLDGVLPLSAALCVMPLAAGAAVPASWWRNWRAGALILGAATLVIVALHFQARPLMEQYGAHQVWWALLLHAWCGTGVVVAITGISGRTLGMHVPRWLRVIIASALISGALVLVPPLTLLYRPQLTSSDADKVIATSLRRELTIMGADGVKLDARLYLPSAGDMRGLVVFTHGVGGWKEGFLNHLWLYLHDGWAVLAYDLRGSGRSSPAPVTYGAREAEDLIRVWDYARGLAEGRPLIASGASMGASITLLAAHRLRGCRAVIAESPFADLGAMLDQYFPTPLVWGARTLAMIGTGWDPAAVKPVTAPVLGDGPPLLLGWIADDRTIPAAQSQAIATAAPRARTLIMAHGTHLDLILHEPWRAEVTALLATIATEDQALAPRSPPNPTPR